MRWVRGGAPICRIRRGLELGNRTVACRDGPASGEYLLEGNAGSSLFASCLKNWLHCPFMEPVTQVRSRNVYRVDDDAHTAEMLREN
jgi:hypothetical protein